MFPLSTFFQSLESDGIRLTVRDYNRIARVLGCNGRWTLARLRDVLLALLAKDENQRELMGRRFDDFFDTRLVVPESDPVDMAGIRAELRNFRQGRVVPPAKPRPSVAVSSRPPVPGPIDSRRWQRLMLFVTLAGLVAVVVVAGWLAYLHILHKAPLLHVTPPAHVLTATPGALETVQFTVNNKGGGELLVKPIPSFSEDDPFEIENDTCRENALTKDKPCLVQIRFKPKDVGTYHAELQVDSDGGNFTAKLTGHCTPII
jgi:hypothetical protein